MLESHDIICFSSDWEVDPLSKHHIITRLAKKNRVLWVNSIGMRRPTLSAKDAGKVLSKLKALTGNRLYCVQNNIYVLNTIVVPFHGSRFWSGINRALLKAQLKFYQNKLKFDKPILWSFLPNAVGIFGELREKLSIYYITDDFTQFTGHPAESLKAMEREIIGKADVVIASAKRLVDRKSYSEKQIHLVTHGVDHGHFRRALDVKPENHPADIKDIKHPTVGFYGEINDWLDLKMMAEAAGKRPDWSFVLLGRVAVGVGEIGYLTRLPNVHWLGRKRYAELPEYCAAFDAALIPMKLNELTLNVNPLKLREYLAAGVPVVSAPLPEVLKYKDVVRFAETAEQLVDEVEKILAKPKAYWSKRLSARVANEGWDAKVEEISEIIQKALDHPPNPLLRQGGERGVVETGKAHHPLTPSSVEEGMRWNEGWSRRAKRTTP